MAGIMTPMQQALLREGGRAAVNGAATISPGVGVSGTGGTLSDVAAKSSIGRALGMGGFGIGQTHGPVGFAGPIGVSHQGFSAAASIANPNAGMAAMGLQSPNGGYTADQINQSNTDDIGFNAMDPDSTVNDNISDGAGSGGGKIICAELHRQGLMDDDTFYADEAYGDLLAYSDPDVVTGYHAWAYKVVEWMRKSKIVTYITLSIAKPWINQMSYEMGARKRGSFTGRAMMKVGYPICRYIAREKDYGFKSV